MMERSGLSNKTNEPLPPRRTKHPSEKGKWLRAFYIGLVLLFVALTVGLMLWGKQLTASGQTESESAEPGLFAFEVKRPGSLIHRIEFRNSRTKFLNST
jgi:hypothetical protein